MTECSTILFHVTKKEYLNDILEKKNVYLYGIEEGWGTSLLGESERKLCSEYVFLSGNIETIES